MNPMYWFFGVVVVVVIALVTLSATGRLGAMPDLVDDRPGPDLPAGDLQGGDLKKAKFAVVFRGYSMTQVDALLARLAVQIDAPVDPKADAHASGDTNLGQPINQPKELVDESKLGSNTVLVEDVGE